MRIGLADLAVVPLTVLAINACQPMDGTTYGVSAGSVERTAVADTILEALRESVVRPWYPRVVDSENGGYLSNFAYDWAAMPSQDKMIVTQARHVWTASRLAEYFPDERAAYLDIAAHGVKFLRDHMWDDEYGGFVSLVERDGTSKRGGDPFTQGKTSYGNAFAIYALAAYSDVSGDTSALALAKRAFLWLDRGAHDGANGGYFQFIERDGSPIRGGWGTHPPKDQNSSIHLLEAFTELYRVWPDPLLRYRLEEMLVLVRDTITTPRGYLQLFFAEDWTPVSYRDSSMDVRERNYELDHVSYGHDIETAYLMLEAVHALGIDTSPTLAVAKRMVDHALEYGWDEEKGGLHNGGYYDSIEESPSLVDDGKTWWAQAEALNSLLLMADHFPADEWRYYDRFEVMWDYIRTFIIDHERGGWYQGGLDMQPEFETAPKASIWKAAYHDGRALMNVVRRLQTVPEE